MNARFFNVLHHAAHKGIDAIGENIDVDFRRVRQISVEQQRVRAQNMVDLRLPVPAKPHLDLRRHKSRQCDLQIISNACSSCSTAMARPPST